MWKVRHEGSPQHAEATLDEIRQALADGLWEPTDEVMGPNESEWTAMENHPYFEEIALDLEPPTPPHHDDETRLDMNALIDVCLVLLVFFMLTTTVAALQVRVEAPGVEEGKVPKVKVVTEKDLPTTILVTATKQGDRIVVKEEEVELDSLGNHLKVYVKKTGKTKMVLQQDDNVPHDVEVKVIAAARNVGIDSVGLASP